MNKLHLKYIGNFSGVHIWGVKANPEDEVNVDSLFVILNNSIFWKSSRISNLTILDNIQTIIPRGYIKHVSPEIETYLKEHFK